MSALKLPELPPIPERLRRPLKWVGYPLFALLVFLVSLWASLPKERIQEQLLIAVGDWLGADVKTEEFGLTLIPGVKASNIIISGRRAPGVPAPLGPDGKPEKPARLLIDDAKVHFGVIPLLRGFTALSWSSHLAQGSADGSYHAKPEEGGLSLDIDGVQLKSFPMLPAAIGVPGVPIEGAVSVKGEITLPQNLMAQSDGAFELTVANAVLGDGKAKVTLPGAGALTVPKVSLGKIAGSAQIVKGRATLHDLKAHSPDIDIEIDGYVELKDPLSLSQLHLYVKLKPSDALIKREAALEAMVNFSGSQARRQDGFFGLTVEGAVGSPSIRPSTVTPAWLNVKPAPPAKPGATPPPAAPPSALSPRPSPPTPPRMDTTPPPLPSPPPPSQPEFPSPTVTPSVAAPPPAGPAPALAEPVNSIPPPPRMGVSARGLSPASLNTATPVTDEARTAEPVGEAPTQ